MNASDIKSWLQSQWRDALSDGVDKADPEVDRFVNSPVASIRYAFFTQLLGKIEDHARDLLCLQMQRDLGEISGAWDPRSFCAKVVVPWAAENQNVLGRSADPYVSNPLRRPRLDADTQKLRDGDEWEALTQFLGKLQDRSDPDEIKRAFARCLASLSRRLRHQQFAYPVPQRVSLGQLDELIETYLSKPSGGLRPQVLATVLFQHVGAVFGLFSKIESQGVNESDAASGALGDIVCYGSESDEPMLAVEVKDHDLQLIELQACIAKARQSDLRKLLFAAPGLASAERGDIEARIKSEWAQGMNVHQVEIESLAHHAFMLLDERHCPEFLKKVGQELDSRAAPHADREDWLKLLAQI